MGGRREAETWLVENRVRQWELHLPTCLTDGKTVVFSFTFNDMHSGLNPVVHQGLAETRDELFAFINLRNITGKLVAL